MRWNLLQTTLRGERVAYRYHDTRMVSRSFRYYSNCTASSYNRLCDLRLLGV